MFCNVCGIEGPDASRFCWKCGQPLNATPSLTPVQQPRQIPGLKPVAKGRFDVNNLTSGQAALIVLGIVAFLVICGLLTDTSKPTAEQETRASTTSTYRDAFISKVQSLMNKADAEANPTRLVHPTVSGNPADKSVLSIFCPKVEPTGGSSDGLCVGVYQGFKNDVAGPNEARIAGFDRIVIWSPHFYKILVLHGEACSPSVFCDALVDSGRIERIQ